MGEPYSKASWPPGDPTISASHGWRVWGSLHGLPGFLPSTCREDLYPSVEEVPNMQEGADCVRRYTASAVQGVVHIGTGPLFDIFEA